MPSVLLVCSSGGHMKQLFTLANRFGIAPEDQFWITSEDGLSRTLLADRRVVWSPFTAPRDGRNILRTRMIAGRVLAQHRFDYAVSTGAEPGGRGVAGGSEKRHCERITSKAPPGQVALR